MKNILIIKTGAAGDVMRTTIVLHLYNDCNIFWLTRKVNSQLLPQQQSNLIHLYIEDFDINKLPEIDTVVSLDDDVVCATIASKVSCKSLIGAYMQDDKVVYTPSANKWFDMGLVSRFGKAKADELKMLNQETYQTLLYDMFGATFTNQPYLTREDIDICPQQNLIGIEARAGARWPTKVWNQFDELAKQLKAKGYEVVLFEEKELLKDYMQDIAKCKLVITGDSLAMHISLALKIKTLAFFTCTSATEIYGYEIMEKVVSPKLMDAFYTNDYRLDVLNAINIQEVLDKVDLQMK